MGINEGLFSSKTPEWETPQDFFEKLDEEFKFVLDVCATDKNRKCQQWYTKEEDALNRSWATSLSHSKWKWMNPPYGREIKHWIKKAANERNVVALLPSRTDTKWFHDYIYERPNTEIRFIKGRLKFGGSKNSAPFPSMIVVFKSQAI